MSNSVITGMEGNMDKRLEALKRDLLKLRTGRASGALVDSIQVQYYGSNVPMSQVSNITTPDARTIQISPWEQNIIGDVEKAILAANIGLTPQSDGKIIRINVPALTEDRRKEMVKTVKKMGEEAKISIRSDRREANDDVKKQEKAKDISEDDASKFADNIQKVTDKKVADVDVLIVAKEKEVMTV